MVTLQTLASKIDKLDERLRRLETLQPRTKKATPTAASPEHQPILLQDVGIPPHILSILQAQIRKVSFMNLLLLMLYFSPRSLTYSEIMEISKELKKPVSYDWLNTEFHRKKYSGLVRSESIPESTAKAYSLNEPGRQRVDRFLAKLKLANE